MNIVPLRKRQGRHDDHAIMPNGSELTVCETMCPFYSVMLMPWHQDWADRLTPMLWSRRQAVELLQRLADAGRREGRLTSETIKRVLEGGR